MKKLAVVLFVAVVLVAGCERVKLMAPEGQTEKESGGTANEGGPLGGSVNVPTIAIHTADKVVNFSVEMAVTDEERAKGLMGRESLAKNYGMWFVFPFEVQDAFWMKDTLISLDMIFVNSDFKIVDIIANAAPRSEEKLMPKAPYRYALEVASGTAASNNIEIGDAVEQRIGPQ